MNRSNAVGLSVLGAVALGAAATGSLAGFTVFAAGGDTTAGSILPTVNGFRNAVGNPNQGAGGGPFTTGRREINWDAPALDASADPNHMPANFFNNNSKRGALFDTPGAGFFVSRRNAGNPSDPNLRFGSINPSYNSEFTAFSAQRLFIADGSTITDVTFRVPSDPARIATVNGFGAVFSDVDLADSSWMEFYDATDNLLDKEFVSRGTAAQGSLSFLGVRFDTDRIARVRIVAGNAAASAAMTDGSLLDTGATADVVAMDDFIYGEPVPAPASMCLAGVLLAGCGRRRR